MILSVTDAGIGTLRLIPLEQNEKHAQGFYYVINRYKLVINLIIVLLLTQVIHKTS